MAFQSFVTNFRESAQEPIASNTTWFAWMNQYQMKNEKLAYHLTSMSDSSFSREVTLVREIFWLWLSVQTNTTAVYFENFSQSNMNIQAINVRIRANILQYNFNNIEFLNNSRGHFDDFSLIYVTKVHCKTNASEFWMRKMQKNYISLYK